MAIAFQGAGSGRTASASRFSSSNDGNCCAAARCGASRATTLVPFNDEKRHKVFKEQAADAANARWKNDLAKEQAMPAGMPGGNAEYKRREVKRTEGKRSEAALPGRLPADARSGDSIKWGIRAGVRAQGMAGGQGPRWLCLEEADSELVVSSHQEIRVESVILSSPIVGLPRPLSAK